jgi:hypothetical protein
VKKVLIQLDTDPQPSAFDSIVAHDAGADVLLRYGDVTAESAPEIARDAFFTRGPGELATIAVWIGGSNVPAGEAVLEAVRGSFFGPFQVSAMLDSNGANTTAATAVAMLAGAQDLSGARAVVVGLGAVGVRSATLLGGEGCEVTVSAIPASRFGDDYRTPRGLAVAREMGLDPVEPASEQELEGLLEGAVVVLAAGPAGVQVLSKEVWGANPTIELLADYNATEPPGLEGVEAGDDLVERDGKRVLGAIAIGGRKMKVHKACLRRLFKSNEEILEVEGVYEIARQVV